MPTRQHSLTRRGSGFVPLDGGTTGNMADNGIPLTNFKSNNSTGNRKPNPANSSSFESSPKDGEKSAHHHHLHHRHGRRRRRPDDTLGRQGTGDSDKMNLNAMGKLYGKIVGFSPIIRHFFYIAPLGLVLAAPLIVLSVLNHKEDMFVGHTKDKDGNRLHGPPLYTVFLFIEIAWLAVWAAKVVAWILPKVFMFAVGIVSTGTRKYAAVLENMRNTLTLFFWALACWLTFKNLFSLSDSKGIDWVNNLRRIFGAVFSSSCVLLVEKAVVQLIGVSYHQRSFANRIKESKREVHLLGILYDASRTLFPMYCHEFSEEDYVINDSIEMVLGGKPRGGNKTGGSVTPLRLIGEAGRVGGKVTSKVGNIASEIAGKQILNPNSAHSIVLGALEKKRGSEALARRIWLSFVIEGNDALYLEDFEEVLGPAYKHEAEEAFYAIDSDMNGDVSLDEMVRKVVEIGKERKAISEGMKDIGQALSAFDKVLMFVVLLITVFIFLAWFKSTFVTIIASAGTTLLSLSFIFSVTCQEFLGSCIFLFVKHPYDVGDRVEINKAQLVVERISLLYSVFTRSDRMQIVQIPNIQLNNYWVDNVSRSKAMLECVEINVSYDTSFEDIELLRLEMEKFVQAPENSRDFKPNFNISVGGVGNLDKMVLQFCIMHKSNWHDDAVRATRRSKFMCALAVAMKKIPINGPGGGGDALGGADNPAYSVSVSDEFAANRRDQSAKAKDAGRMVPTQTDKTAEEAREAEEQAIAEINTRPAFTETSELWDAGRPSEPETLPSDPSADRKRDADIEAMRQDLRKSESQRGRRKAGEGLQSLASMDTGAARAGSLSRNSSRRMETFDEEAETGMPSNFYEANRGQRPSEGSQQQLQASLSQRSRASGRQGPPPAGHR